MNRLWTMAICALLFVGLAAGPAAAQEEEQQQEEQEQVMDEAEEEAEPAGETVPQTGWTPPVAVEHEIKDPGKCLACHKTGMMDAPVVPDTHMDRPDATCMWCHGPEAEVQTTEPAAMGHELDGKHTCLQCHRGGVDEEAPDVPASHEGRTDEYCTLCHSPGNE